MKHIPVLLLAVAMGSGVVIAQAQTSTPTQEPPAKLIVDAPLHQCEAPKIKHLVIFRTHRLLSR